MTHKSRLRKKQILFARQNGVCFYCYKKLTINTFTIDHIIPKSKKGKDCLSNLVGSCQKCNEVKGSKIYPEQIYLYKHINYTDFGNPYKKGKTVCVNTDSPKTLYKYNKKSPTLFSISVDFPA